MRTGKPTTPGETAWYKEEPTNPVVGPRSSRAREHNNFAAYLMAVGLQRFLLEEFLSCDFQPQEFMQSTQTHRYAEHINAALTQDILLRRSCSERDVGWP
jgi:hypothetical protein